MAEKFQEQGGAATMDPSRMLRWLTSRIMTRLCKPENVDKRRDTAERERVKAGSGHVVEYFHQVEDGYSHLAAQILQRLSERYDIELVCHLVTGPAGRNAAEPELLLQLSRYDTFHVAPEYDLVFPAHEQELDPALVSLAGGILAAQDNAGFVTHSAAVGSALWADDETALKSLSQQLGQASEQDVAARIAAGNERREALKHYSGAMFYYGGEWYWGVDRLYLLEQRLAKYGADTKPGEPLLVPRPDIVVSDRKDNGSLTLEVFPSLRSPYTSISFDRTVKLAQDTGVKLVVRPVLPMVMRGVPATRQKGMYIFLDTAREARAAGVPYGNFYDPIGEPARRGYSLYPWACEQGRGTEFLSAFLSGAFAQGINLNKDSGLKKVVEQAGLDWTEAQKIVGNKDWQEQLESNRLAMYNSGLWGVPSFRLLDENGVEVLALWGQDRLWLFAREIQRRIEARQQ